MSNVRILAGVAKGRAVHVPESARPTGVRVRKSLFDLLDHHFETDLSFGDLYAGSGAVGLEAASRGYLVTLVESNGAAFRLLEKNSKQLDLSPRIVRSLALDFLQNSAAFDVLFIDPPFSQDLPAIALSVLKLGKVRPNGVCIFQHPSQVFLAECEDYTLERRSYGSNALTFYWGSSDL